MAVAATSSYCCNKLLLNDSCKTVDLLFQLISIDKFKCPQLLNDESTQNDLYYFRLVMTTHEHR